jgi:hypothetical protein
MLKNAVLVLALASLASCGGDSSPDAYQDAVDQASAAHDQAIALAVPTPCNSTQQCAIMTLAVPSGRCSISDYHAYSLVSPTADAASAAAANERALAQYAASLSPPTACPASIVLPPSAACVANTCQTAAPN